MMNRAIVLALRGQGRVEPNPMVGCVVVKNGRIIGRGWHRRFGGPHAEVNALRACSESPQGATAYVTLEPCCHTGKTPPCTLALVKAGIARVVVAMNDPNRPVNGRGVRALSKAGIAVTTGVLADEAAEVLAPYLTRIQHGRPYVIAKWAQSLNGRLATVAGDSRWISCEASRKMVHKLRARVDAVMVGSRTVASDDPMLTARGVPLRRLASRVVVDGRLHISVNRKVIATAPYVPTIVFTSSPMANGPKAEKMGRLGVDVVGVPDRAGRLSLQRCLSLLAKRGMTNVLVEGGANLISALLAARLVDEAWVFTAPILIEGSAAPQIVGGKGRPHLADAIIPQSVATKRIGCDMLHRLRLTNPPR